MKKISFSIKINASKESVWATLWDDATYGKWTSVFSPDSHAVSDWKQGSEVKFIDNKGDGMLSNIETIIPFEQMSFKHQAMMEGGVETTKDWAGSMENYFLKETNGVTDLTIDMDINAEYESFFVETFPKALELVKQISETK